MELEQRIRSIELEMRILKNEINRTLLDVQEQVLLNQRPIITVESKPAGSMARPIQPVRAQQPAPAAIPAPTAPAAPAVSVAPAAPMAPTVSATPATPTAPVTSTVHQTPTAPVAAPVPGPVLKKVSLEEIRAAQNELEAEATPTNSVAVDKLVELVQKPVSEANESTNGDAATLAERGGVKLLEWLMSSATKVNGEGDEKRVSEVLDKLTQLNSLVDRASSMEEALRLIEEAKLG